MTHLETARFFRSSNDLLVRSNVVDPVELCNLLRSGIVESGREHDLTKVDIEGVAPNREPPSNSVGSVGARHCQKLVEGELLMGNLVQFLKEGPCGNSPKFYSFWVT